MDGSLLFSAQLSTDDQAGARAKNNAGAPQGGPAPAANSVAPGSVGILFGASPPPPPAPRAPQSPVISSPPDPTSGTWTPVPGFVGSNCNLMPDGSLISFGSDTNTVYRITPDASGNYANPTITPLASMTNTRLYFGSNVLPDSRVFVGPSEYGSGTNNAEVYNPATNTWSWPYPVGGAESASVLLSDGNIYIPSSNQFFNPSTNTLSAGPASAPSFVEAGYVLLPDQSYLTFDASNNAYRLVNIPGSGWQFVSAGSLPANMWYNYEIGPGMELADGRVFWVGGTGQTALYTPPTTLTGTGSWHAGPALPSGLFADDAAGAVLPDGQVFFLADVGNYSGPSTLFDYDPSTNSITTVSSAPSAITGPPSYYTTMVVLPTGQLLVDTFGTLNLFTPSDTAPAAWAPTVTGITNLGNGNYKLTGTQINGWSEGSNYGDDNEEASNFPLVRLTDTSGNVYYAPTSSWAPGTLGMGSASLTTDFTLPAGIPGGTYSLAVIANGIASTPVSFTVAPHTPTALTATAGPGEVTLNWTGSTGATSYSIYRSTSSGTETLLTYNITSTSFIDTNVVHGTTYYYEVQAVNSGGVSQLSNEASANPLLAPPPAPGSLTATAGNAQVSLNWNASTGATSYEILRGTSSGGETLLVSGITTASYLDTNVTNGITYYYEVKAVNSAGVGTASNQASAKPTKPHHHGLFFTDGINQLWLFQDGNFVDTGAFAKVFSAGIDANGNGECWFLDGNNQLWRYDNGVFTNIGAFAQRIAAGQGFVAFTDGNNQLWTFTDSGSHFLNTGGFAGRFTVGYDSNGNNQIVFADGVNGLWTYEASMAKFTNTGAFTKLFVAGQDASGNSEIWFTDGNNEIWRLDQGQSKAMGAFANRITASAAGQMYFVDGINQVWSLTDGGAGTDTGAFAEVISSGSGSTALYFTDGINQIWQYLDGSFTNTGGFAERFSAF
jgi:hypothetical protein